MPRRVVWYPAGSPAATQISALPADLEALPLPAGTPPAPGPDESAAALVDLPAGDAAVAAGLARGARIFRVHDVAPVRHALAVAEAVLA